MNFYIRKNSTLPILKYPLYDSELLKYGITEDMFDNIAVTFSMFRIDDNRYYIANNKADYDILKTKADRERGYKYSLNYSFSEDETSIKGTYVGEFVVDFLGADGCGKIKFPVSEEINIFITDSITKTTVV